VAKVRNREQLGFWGRNAYLVPARTWSKVLVGKIELFYAEGAVVQMVNKGVRKEEASSTKLNTRG
jgi:hypothetical protein